MAGFDTVSSKWKKKLLDDYKDQLKKRNMQNKKSQDGRKTFEEDFNIISHPNLEKTFAEDRIRREGGRKEEGQQRRLCQLRRRGQSG